MSQKFEVGQRVTWKTNYARPNPQEKSGTIFRVYGAQLGVHPDNDKTPSLVDKRMVK
jgi:uncharacterized protein Veg